MIIGWDNKVDAATVTAGSEIATLPGSNVKVAHLSQKWHTLAGVKASSLTLDLGSQLSCSLLALLGTNLTSASTVRLRASKTDSAATSALELDTGKMPAGVKSGYSAAYRQIRRGSYLSLASDEQASSAFDFTARHLADLIGNGAITVTRSAATATRVNERGKIETVAADTPRFDHDPVAKTCKGLLVEETRQNLCLDNADLSTGNWTKADSTIATNQIAAPDEAITADLITEGVAGTAGLTQAFTGTANASYAVSRFFKRGNTDWVALQVFNGLNVVRAWFNLATGAVGSTAVGGSGAAAATRIKDFGDGWYRAEFVCSVGSGATAISVQSFSAAADLSTTRVNNATRYEWGGGHEDNVSFASSYIPTGSSAVTRNTDTIAQTALGAWFNPSEGTGAVEFMPSNNTSYVTFEFDDGTSANRYGHYRNAGAPNQRGYNANASVVDFDTGSGDIAANAVGRVAVAFKTNDCAISVNGAASVTDTVVALSAAVTRMEFGRSQSSGFIMNGWLRRFTYYRKRLTNAKLEAVGAGTAVDVATAPQARYWRLDIEDTTVADNLQIGRVFLGPTWLHSQTMIYGWGVTPMDPSQVDKSRGGQSFPDVRSKFRALDFRLDFLTEAQMFDNAFAAARANGVVKDWLVVPFESGSYISEQSVWGLMQAYEPVNHRLSQTFTQKFRIEERL